MQFHILTAFVLSGCILHTTRAQNVGTVCTNGGTECADAKVDCNLGNLKCECADTYINPSTGTCIKSDCTNYAACTTKSILKSKCDGSNCVCDDLSEPSTVADITFGSCISKVCTANGGECGTTLNAVCDTTTDANNPVCACDTTFILKEGSCTARVIGGACTTESAQCSGIKNAYCISSACTCGPLYTGASCAAKTCSENTDCPTNAVCSSGSCACGTISAEDSVTGECEAIACTANGNECTGTNTVCDTSTDHNAPVCACDTTYILSDGACIARVIGDACTTESAQCSGINNAYCISSACTCGPLYTGASCAAKTCSENTDCPINAVCSSGSCACGTIFAEDSVTGECEAIACTANGNECTGTNTVCDTTTDHNAPVCACDTTYILSDGACIARDYGDACSSDANCADIGADAVCDTTSLCKIGAGNDCTGNTDCVANSACGSDKTCDCSSGYNVNTNKQCVAESGAGAIAMSTALMLMAIIMLFI